MKIIVAGSRTIEDRDIVEAAIKESGFVITEIVSGGARGVDAIGESFAVDNFYPYKVFNADWDTHGKKAGILRNIEMAAYADALVAVRLGDSKGTTHMIEEAIRKGLKVFIYEISLDENGKFQKDKAWTSNT